MFNYHLLLCLMLLSGSEGSCDKLIRPRHNRDYIFIVVLHNYWWLILSHHIEVLQVHPRDPRPDRTLDRRDRRNEGRDEEFDIFTDIRNTGSRLSWLPVMTSKCLNFLWWLRVRVRVTWAFFLCVELPFGTCDNLEWMRFIRWQKKILYCDFWVDELCAGAGH